MSETRVRLCPVHKELAAEPFDGEPGAEQLLSTVPGGGPAGVLRRDFQPLSLCGFP